MVAALYGSDKWGGCCWPASSQVLPSPLLLHNLLWRDWKRDWRKESLGLLQQPRLSLITGSSSLSGRTAWYSHSKHCCSRAPGECGGSHIGVFCCDRGYRESVAMMGGLTLTHGLQQASSIASTSTKKKEGRRISSSFLVGEDVRLSGRRLGFRRKAVNYERVSLGFSCGGSRRVVVVSAARLRATESAETSAPESDSVRDDKQPPIKRTAGAKGSEGNKSVGNKSKGRPKARAKKVSPKKAGEQLPPGPGPGPGPGPAPTPAPSEDETKRPRQVKTPANPIPSKISTHVGEENGHLDHAKETTRDVKLTIQRVLEARALLASKLQDAEGKPSSSGDAAQKDLINKNTISMAREVLAGYRKGSKEKGRLFEGRTTVEGDGVQDWGASLSRSGLLKPLVQKGSLWRRDLGTLNDHQNLPEQSDIVRKVVGALSGIRNSTAVTTIMNDFVGRVTTADLKQVLYALGVAKEWLTALQVFEWMQTMPAYKPDEPVYRTMIILLTNCRRMDVAEATFEDFVKVDRGPGHEDYVVLISGFVKSGSLQRALAILAKMRDAGVRPQLSAYNVLLDGCTKSSKGLEVAAELLEQMKQENVTPDRATYIYMIIMYSRKGRHQQTVQMFENMRLSSCVPDKATYNTVLTAYSKLGDVKGMMDAHRLMTEQGVEQDSVTFNILLAHLNRLGRIRDVGRYWALMRKSRTMPDLTTCSILINAFGRAREWDEVDIVLQEMERLGLQADLTVYNSLIAVYGKAALFYEVELIINSLRTEIARQAERGRPSLSFDLVTYNTLLDVYGKAGRLDDVIQWFAEMKKAGVRPDVRTFNSLVNAYGKASHFDGVKEVLELFQNYNYKPDLVFYNTLLFMFGRGGHYTDAWKILEDMKQAGFAPTLETYNSLILVFGRGSLQQGLEMFADMLKSKVEPNVVTLKLLMDIHAKKGLLDECLNIYYDSPRFLNIKCEESLISAAFAACCNMRSVEKAEELVLHAEAEGVDISLACYNWLILGYGKKGQWQEAENVVDRMKAKGVKPNSQSFSFLLEAYSLSGQVPKGELLIAKMKDGNFISGTPGYNAFLRFYSRAGDIGSAFQTYEMLQTSGPKPNQSSSVPMIEALTQEGAVDERFWGIIQDIENAPFEAKYAIHSALLSTLARCGPTQDGVRVLKTLELLGCPPDVLILFKPGAVSQGAANTEDDIWKRMKGLFNSMEREGINLEAERNFHNALIDALWSFQYEMRALKLTELSVMLGVFGSNVCEWQGDGWALDLRHTGVGASQVLLLTWLAGIREDIKSGGKMSSKIRILLAWEWQLRTGENWAARDAMAARLKELKAPFVLVKDGQQLEVNASTLRKWLLREITARRLVFNSRV